MSSENLSFQSYQNKNTMNKNANSAEVRCLTRATTKAKRKRRSLLKSLYLVPVVYFAELV